MKKMKSLFAIELLMILTCGLALAQEQSPADQRQLEFPSDDN